MKEPPDHQQPPECQVDLTHASPQTIQFHRSCLLAHECPSNTALKLRGEHSTTIPDDDGTPAVIGRAPCLAPAPSEPRQLEALVRWHKHRCESAHSSAGDLRMRTLCQARPNDVNSAATRTPILTGVRNSGRPCSKNQLWIPNAATPRKASASAYRAPIRGARTSHTSPYMKGTASTRL